VPLPRGSRAIRLNATLAPMMRTNGVGRAVRSAIAGGTALVLGAARPAASTGPMQLFLGPQFWTAPRRSITLPAGRMVRRPTLKGAAPM